jgi:aryl-alcohol dehydrogenase-like predicted oxidoreductase
MHNQYNLLRRQDEPELMAMCADTGATKPHHLPEAVAALGLTLTDDEAATLEEPYTNHGPSWY